MMATANENSKTLANLNEERLEGTTDRGMIDITNPEHTSQFKPFNDLSI